jgi:hypothetical protein
MTELSLCIATMKRWDFLKISLPLYLENECIKEIVITDETGEDYELITNHYKNNPKIKVYKNTKRLGPFLNKLECMKKASCDWICLMDSDNFADKMYFQTFLEYTNKKPDIKTVYCPSKAKPNFDYTLLQNKIINKNTLESFRKLDNTKLETAFNTGNYIINKSTIDAIESSLSASEEFSEISKLYQPRDVIFMNYLLLLKDFSFIIVPQLEHNHVIHPGNLYTTTHRDFTYIMNKIHMLFRGL